METLTFEFTQTIIHYPPFLFNFISFATQKLLFAYKHNNISRSILEYYAYTHFSLPYVPIFLPP